MQNLINKLTNQLDNLKHFNSVQMLMSHPWIVCSECLTYSINTSVDGLVNIQIDNHFPTQYIETTADELISDFICFNGNSKIRFIKIGWKEYTTRLIGNTEEMLAVFGTTC